MTPTGIVLKANECFGDVFQIAEQSSIDQMIMAQSLKHWQASLRRVMLQGNIKCEIPMKIPGKGIHPISMDLHVTEGTKVIVVHMYLPVELTEWTRYNWKNIFEKSIDLRIICDDAGVIRNLNGYTLGLIERLTGQLEQSNIREILSLFSRTDFSLQAFKQQVEKEGYAETIEQYIHLKGQIRYYKISSRKDPLTQLFLIKISDVTESTILQQQLAQKDALLEVGQLAASVAHEIRNPMTTLKGFTQLLKMSAEQESLKYLTVIEDEIDRMEHILSEMLNLSKPATLQKETISLHRLLEDIIQIIKPTAVLENIQVMAEYETSESIMISGEERKLKQVLLNLMKNSLESMRFGGILSIHTTCCAHDTVNILIKDTGKGIEEQYLTRIFMPYFTTRQDGTGLGLPFVLKTVEDHEGTVSVSSEIGKGTSFILQFPKVHLPNSEQAVPNRDVIGRAEK